MGARSRFGSTWSGSSWVGMRARTGSGDLSLLLREFRIVNCPYRNSGAWKILSLMNHVGKIVGKILV